MKVAVIYARVSTEEQAKKGISIDTQLQDCQVFATTQGYTIREQFIDRGKSAKNINRPELQKMLKYCSNKRNKVDAVIVWRNDRLSRCNEDFHGILMKTFRENNIKLLSVNEINVDTPEGIFIRNISMCNAEFERNLISIRTKKNLKTIAISGRRPTRPPIGYLYDKATKSTLIDEVNAEYVRRIYEKYATGLYSFKSLADEMYYEGFRTPKTGQKYSSRRMEEILHNMFYTGKYKWGDEIIEGTHQPIISSDLYYLVQDRFKLCDKIKKHNEEFAYRGLIKCAKCGSYFTTQFKKGKSKRGKYYYYNCSNSKGYHKSLKHYDERYFDNSFANMLGTIHLTDEQVAKIRQLTKNHLKEYIESEKKNTLELRTKIDSLKNRIQTSYIEKLEGRLPYGMSDEQFNEMHHNWQIEMDKLKLKLEEIEASNKEVYKRIDVLLMFSQELPRLFLKATKTEKHIIVEAMTKSITFDGETLNIELKDTFKALQNVKNDAKIGVRNEVNRTPSNLVLAIKNDVFETSFKNGAGGGIRTHA